MLLLLPAAAGQERPTVAVVLSGGGAKGVAHIGALRVIEEAGIPIDIVCGTSMGALVGGLYSMGYSTDFLDSLVRAQDWTTLLSDRTDPSTLTLRQREEQNTYIFMRRLGSVASDRGGVIRGHNVESLLRSLTIELPDSISFDSLPTRFACVATDLVLGREIDFHSGNLVEAMRASMAIPGVFTPVRKGENIVAAQLAVLNSESDGCFTVRQIADVYNMRPEDLNSFLVDQDIQRKWGGRYHLLSPYDDQGLAQDRTVYYYSLEGKIKRKTYLVWTERGRDFVMDLLKD